MRISQHVQTRCAHIRALASTTCKVVNGKAPHSERSYRDGFTCVNSVNTFATSYTIPPGIYRAPHMKIDLIITIRAIYSSDATDTARICAPVTSRRSYYFIQRPLITDTQILRTVGPHSSPHYKCNIHIYIYFFFLYIYNRPFINTYNTCTTRVIYICFYT
jgi:hypothetical protein